MDNAFVGAFTAAQLNSVRHLPRVKSLLLQRVPHRID